MRLKGKKVVVAGLDKSGIGAVKYFKSRGADVTVTDLRNRLEVQKAIALLKDFEFKAEFGRYSSKTFCDADMVLYSMRTKHDERVFAQTKECGVPMKTEYEFTAGLITKPIVCVTGTNGKSSTAVLLSEMLAKSGKKTYITGHIGKSIYEYLMEEDQYDYLILELDSDYFKYSYGFDFDTVVLLNLTDEKLLERSDSWQTFADHVNLYMDFIATSSREKTLVYSRDCEDVFTVVSNVKARSVPFSLNFSPQDIEAYKYGAVYVSGNDLVIKKSKSSNNYDISNMRLKGGFNKHNFMAASFVAKKYGASDQAIEFVLNNFAGIEHRLELVQNKNSVNFYNDARVSTIRGLIRSLSSFTKPVVLIAGGKDNGENYEDLCPYIRKNVKTLILMGESKERMNRVVGDCTETFVVGTFEEAVVLAYQKSKRGDVILYSPGCSPSDGWTKIEERGKRYKEIIKTF